MVDITIIDFLRRVLDLYFERNDFFIELFFEHIVIASMAIFFITIIGIPLGILITRNKKLAFIVINITNFFYTIPAIAIFGLMVPIVGLGLKNALFAITIYGLLPIVRNTYVGIMDVNQSVIQAAKGMGSTDFQILKDIQVPLALPVIVAGFRTMAVMAISMSGIAAFLGAGGLGVAIWRGITTNYHEMIFAGSILVAMLAVTADTLLGVLERKMIKRVQGIEIKGGILND